MSVGEPTDELALLREAQDRRLESEGIPMVLTLVSEVGAMPDTASQDVRGDGQRLAGRLARYREALIPTSRDTDMGCLITALVVASYSDFGRDEARL